MNIAAWLRELGLERYEPAFRDNEVDWEVVPELTESDLERIGLPLGPRKKLLKAIAGLSAEASEEAASRPRPVAPEAERRQLTVMFCDLVGSTALSGRLDPEDLGDVIGLYREGCTDIIERYGGNVAKFLGDGMLVYFGYPLAHEDDAERAVRAGLGIVEKLPVLNASLRIPDYELKVRIGIATGLVVVGDAVGEGHAEKAAVVGETPNLAARLQDAAEPNTVVVGRATRQLLGERFELSDLGLRVLKGVPAPQRIWRVGGENVAESRFTAAHREAIELVDRTTELANLLAGWQRVKDGAGQAMALVGEAGIGKSHLLQALLERVAADPHTHLHCQCSPHHSNSVLYPIVRQLERACRFERGDSTAVKREKLARWLTGPAAARDSLMPGFARLLAIPEEPDLQAPGPDARQPGEAPSAALAHLAAGLTERQPLVLVFEDIQWIDPSSLELIGELARRAPGLRMLLVITHRPGQVQTWAGRAQVEQVVLGQMAQVHSEAIIERSAGGRKLPRAVVEEIVSKSGGMPLFVAELTRAVVESGVRDTATADKIGVPATLQDALMARLDRLGEAKEVAQTAAVLGISFSKRVLAAVVPHPPEALESALALLMRTDLVRHSGPTPDDGYQFRNALIRDLAYQALLRRRRQALHERVATILERDFPDVVEAEPEVLAHHFTEAGLHARAVEHWQRAGRRAMERFGTQEAATLFAKALNMPEVPVGDYQEMLLQADLGAAEMQHKGFDYATAVEAFLRAYQGTPGGDDPLRLGRSLKAMVWFHCRQMKLDRARDLARLLLRLSESHHDPGLSTAAHQSAGMTALLSSELTQARAHFERAIAHYDASDHRALADQYGLDPGINCSSLGAVSLWLLGLPDQASRWVADSLAQIDGLSHEFTVSVTQSWAARIFAMLGDDRATQHWAAVTISYATEHDVALSLAEGSIMSGWVLARQRRAEGLEVMERGLGQKRDSGSRLLMPYYLGRLAEARAMLGQHDAALDTLAEAIEVAHDTGEQWWAPELHRLRGALLAEAGDAATEAESCMQRALEMAGRAEALSLELRAATSLHRLLHACGRQAEAHTQLSAVYGRFSEGFETTDLLAARRLLGT